MIKLEVIVRLRWSHCASSGQGSYSIADAAITTVLVVLHVYIACLRPPGRQCVLQCLMLLHRCLCTFVLCLMVDAYAADRQWSWPLPLPPQAFGIFPTGVIESDDQQLPWSDELEHKIFVSAIGEDSLPCAAAMSTASKEAHCNLHAACPATARTIHTHSPRHP